MNTFNDIAENLKSKLENTASLLNVKFIMNLPVSNPPSLINKVYAAVSISKIFISDGSFSGYFGLSSGKEIYGRLADIEIKIKIYSPKELPGTTCYETFTNIYNALLIENNELNVQSVSCADLKYDNDISAFTLDVCVKTSKFIGC